MTLLIDLMIDLLIDYLTEPYLLIMEYVMYGKLLAFLRDHRTRQHYYNFSEDSDALTSRDLTIFAYCVARGMEYLSSKGVRTFKVQQNISYLKLV
jgi:serine/threonine protein kinase